MTTTRETALAPALSTPAADPQGYVGGLEATLRMIANHPGYAGCHADLIRWANEAIDNRAPRPARPAPQPAADTRVVSMTSDRSEIDRIVAALRTGRHGSHISNDAADWIERLSDAEFEAVLRLNATPAPSYQSRVKPWLDACFGPEIAGDKTERNHRFLEEALELVQSGGCTASEAHQLVDYVYGRPVGEMGQEIGGVMNTLAALCLAYGRDMHEDGETELARVWTKVEKIRAKQAAKPKHSPLPEHTPAPSDKIADAARVLLDASAPTDMPWGKMSPRQQVIWRLDRATLRALAGKGE